MRATFEHAREDMARAAAVREGGEALVMRLKKTLEAAQDNLHTVTEGTRDAEQIPG